MSQAVVRANVSVDSVGAGQGERQTSSLADRASAAARDFVRTKTQELIAQLETHGQLAVAESLQDSLPGVSEAAATAAAKQIIDILGKDPSKVSEDQLQCGLATVKTMEVLAGRPNSGSNATTVSTTSYIGEVTVGNHKIDLSTFEDRRGQGYSLTILAGVSMREVIEAINVESQRKYNRNAIYIRNLDDAGLTKFLDAKSDKAELHRMIPLVNNSTRLNRAEHSVFVTMVGLSFADDLALLVAAGLYRLGKGFPDANSGIRIGSSEDKGDLFCGKWCRAASFALGSDDDGAYVHVVTAGALSDDGFVAGRLPESK